jgi:hypothetical protein
MPIMPIEAIDDWSKRIERTDAFWRRELVDRPVVVFSLPRDKHVVEPPPEKHWPIHRDRWLDFDHRAEKARAGCLNRDYWGDALPMAMPNLGPDTFCGFFGAELEFAESTSWSHPVIDEWSNADRARFDTGGYWWKAQEAFIDRMIEAGQGVFYTGVPDLHPGGDCAASLRGPMNFNIDLIEHPDEVKRLLARIDQAYVYTLSHYFDRMRQGEQAVTSWPGIVSSVRWAVVQNDFSCMISPEMFEAFFLPGIADECRHADATLYHLDGPGALRHLDALLAIPELTAIQWVYGAGNGPASKWIDVYKRCQAADKAIQIVGADVTDLDAFIEELRPEGVWLALGGVENADQADWAMRRIEGWR